MGISIGSTPVTAVRLGATPILAVRLGSQLIWQPGGMRDPFTGTDINLDPTKWSVIGSGGYVPVIINDYVRLFIPNGLIAESLRTGTAKYIAGIHGQDNCRLETKVATQGDTISAMYTQVWCRANNTPNDQLTSAVGMEFRAGSLFITRKVASNDQQMLYCGAYSEGDVIVLDNNARDHSMYRNGRHVGTWQDLGATALMGGGNRSLAFNVNGRKDFFGPRRFSAGLEYIELS